MSWWDYREVELLTEPITLDFLAIDTINFEDGANIMDLGSFERGTQLKITPVTRTENRGFVRTVAHKMTATFITVNNNLQLLPDAFDNFINRRVQLDVFLRPKGLVTTRPDFQRVLNFSKSDRSPYFDDLEEISTGDVEFDNRASITYDTEVVDEHRVRLVINAQAWIQNFKYVRFEPA